MVYNPATSTVILFGGIDADEQVLTDTWAYDPVANAWTELHPAGESPRGSLGFPMVYDPSSGEAVLFGDLATTGPWAYNPVANAWTWIKTSQSTPDARTAYAAAYESKSGKLIIFGGGKDEGTGDLVNPWAYDLATHTWTELHPKGDMPPALASHAMVYDPASKRAILFGGADHDQSDGAVNDTWAYESAANAWTKLLPGGDLPSPRTGHAMVYDPVSKKVILFGGVGGQGDESLNDTWAYDLAANTWTNLQPSGDPPPARSSYSTVYDPIGRKMIIFGGAGAEGLFNDIWTYDPAANTWTKLAGSAAPSTGD
jgi:N-acetylneuraminic acid mutarotase